MMIVKARLLRVWWILVLLPVFPFAVAAEETPRLRLASADIADWMEQDGRILLKLTPVAVSRLRALTAQSYGRKIEIELDAVPLLSAIVHATIDSGVIQVNDPTPAVVERLESIQGLRSKGR
ncbi:MAG: hypothetical protein WC383_10425 [Gammaproteobacteria bacterium]